MANVNNKPGDWWDRSWTIVSGCNWKKGEKPPACANCWAEGTAKRFPKGHREGVPWSKIVCHDDRLSVPVRCRKPTVYAVSLMGDLFHPDVLDEYISEVYGRMYALGHLENYHLQFVVLTKRYKRAARYLKTYAEPAWGECAQYNIELKDTIQPLKDYLDGKPLKNTILMASVWDQASADEACKYLSGLERSWGLHIEPILAEVNLGLALSRSIGGAFELMKSEIPSWIVVGGENAPNARPMHPAWARNIRDQCQSANIPFWFKSWGTWGLGDPYGMAPVACIDRSGRIVRPAKGSKCVLKDDFPKGSDSADGWEMIRKVGKAQAGRELDGKIYEEVPW